MRANDRFDNLKLKKYFIFQIVVYLLLFIQYSKLKNESKKKEEEERNDFVFKCKGTSMIRTRTA
jgi:hypothetical protein